MLQAFLVLPALALVYLVAARRERAEADRSPAGRVRRDGRWPPAGGSRSSSCGRPSSRPYIGGSQDNSILELTLGYNGFGRLTGDETGSVGGGVAAPAARCGARPASRRLFNSEIGGQIAWLLPAALMLLVAGFWFTAAAGRAPTWSVPALIVWGGWLLVTGLTFSFMAGIFHAYYTVALAPAVAALVGIGAWLLWEHRRSSVAGP